MNVACLFWSLRNEPQLLSKRDKNAEEEGIMKQSLLFVSLALEFRCTWVGLNPSSSEVTYSEEANPLKENKEDVFTF